MPDIPFQPSPPGMHMLEIFSRKFVCRCKAGNNNISSVIVFFFWWNFFLNMIYTLINIFLKPLKFNGIWSWWQFFVQFCTKWNSNSKGKWSPRSYSLQFERIRKSICQSVYHAEKKFHRINVIVSSLAFAKALPGKDLKHVHSRGWVGIPGRNRDLECLYFIRTTSILSVIYPCKFRYVCEQYPPNTLL